MIGQTKLLDIITRQIESNNFPRFSIIVGTEGSGKKTLSKAIAYALNCHYVLIDPKVDAVRDMMRSAYSVAEPTLYVIYSGDTLSVSAKNALLKVCEETPNNAYIMMLVEDITTVLDTLYSRAGRYYMQPYSTVEILEYANVDNSIADIVTDLCETPGDVNTLNFIGAEEFYSYVEKVVDNVADVSTANALKIANQIDVKGNDSNKYDVKLFLRAFKSICGKRLMQNIAENGDIVEREHYSGGIKVASNSLLQLNIVGINKGALFDIFILNIRKEWS
jgi:DNA polymerase III delta prime subunit